MKNNKITSKVSYDMTYYREKKEKCRVQGQMNRIAEDIIMATN